MNPDFIQLKAIDGELKLSHKKSDFGVTVSTRELVFHKPHVNYHIKLADIISILPFEPKGRKRTTVSVENFRQGATEQASASAGGDQYKLYVKAATMHNRSGIFPTGMMQFVLPLHPKLMKVIADYSELSVIT